jgi:hypothetical protein
MAKYRDDCRVEMSLLLRVYPALSKFAKAVGLKVSQEPAGLEEIWPAESLYSRPVFMDADDWDRIARVQSETTIEAVKARVAGGMRQHGPTLRMTYRDVLATPAGFYTAGQSYNRHGPSGAARLLTGRIQHHRAGHFGLPRVGMRYFGHWLRDGMGASLLRREGDNLYFPVDPEWNHAVDYASRLIPDRLTESFVHFDEMTFSPDIGQNSHRRARLREIHSRLQRTLPRSTADGVFIARGSSGASRRLVNEDEIASTLAAKSFNVCRSDDPLETILAACSGARIVVSMEGSQATHGFFSARLGAVHVQINPFDRFNTVLADYVPALEQRLAAIVAGPDKGGYRIDADRLLSFIDRCHEATIAGAECL